MTAATTAAFRGHRVELYEKQDRLGGQLVLAGTPPYKEELNELMKYLRTQLDKSGAKVLLGTEVTPELVQKLQPDAVVVATGATPIVPKIVGVDRPNVVHAWEVLRGRYEPKGRVVVVGAGCQGCETAEYVAAKGKDVTIVEMLPELAWDMEPFTRIFLLERFQKYGVKVFKSTIVDRIETGAISARNTDGKRFSINADTVIICVGSRANDGLHKALEGKVEELYKIGDCEEPARILEAIHAGTNVGHQI